MARRYKDARELIEWETARIATQFACEEDSVWKWAEQNVVLQARATSQPGRYDSSWVPYVRAWQDDFCNPHIRRVVIVKGGQMGGTESLLNMVRYSIARDPGPTLWVMPSENLGRSFSETRLQPSLYDCDATRDQIPSDLDKFKLLEYQLRDAVLNIVGSNSPANLASRPIRYLFGDELDKWAEASEKEASALELARVRLATFWNSKEVLTSTPTTERGQIWQEFLLGDQRRYFVPCPHCGYFQALVWSGNGCGVKWPDDERTKRDGKWNLDAVEKLAYYLCEKCQKPIEQSQRRKMILAGEWRPTNPHAPAEIRSYHVSALVSPFAKHDWGKLAARFLQAKDTFGGLQDFCNSVLAEPWKEHEVEADPNQLLDRRGDYGGADAWDAELVRGDGLRGRIIGVDVQQDVIYWRCRMFGADGVSRGHGWGRCFTFDEINEVQKRLGVHSRFVAVDSGYRTQEVYRACVTYGWTAIKGVEAQDFLVGGVRQVYKLSQVDPSFRDAASVPLYLLADDGIQDILSLFLAGKAGHWTFEVDAGNEYIAQVCSEEKRADPKTGKVEWHRIRRANHIRDCEKIILFTALACKPPILRA